MQADKQAEIQQKRDREIEENANNLNFQNQLINKKYNLILNKIALYSQKLPNSAEKDLTFNFIKVVILMKYKKSSNEA